MEFLNLLPKLWQFQSTVNAECKKHIFMTVKHLAEGSPWALQMFDSSTKVPAGLMEGNTVDLGNFDECININVEEDWGSFKGQHCLASASLNFLEKKAVSFTWSMCIPSSCTLHDLNNLLFTALNQTMYVNPASCHIKERRSFTYEDSLALSVLSIFGLLCILSTVYDLRVTGSGKKKDILRVFSWYTNGKRLLKIRSHSGEIMKCLYGLRFLSIVWITIGHSFLMQGAMPKSNMNTYRKALAGGDRFLIGISTFSVESFFLISGLLVGYTFFKTMEKGKKFSFPFSCIKRYLRLTPVLALTTLIYSGLIMHMGSGPIWEEQMQPYSKVCRKNWWATLLYMQNYIDTSERCITESWYLAVDTQLYVLSPLLLIPLLKRPRYGPTLLKLAIGTSITSSFLQLYINAVTFGFQVEKRHEFAELFYTHTRATSWLIGLSLSFLLHKTRSWRQDINQWIITGLSKKSVLIGWLLGSMCLILPVAWGHRFTQTDFLPSSLEFSLYFSLTKPLWCLGLSWLIFACLTGHAGPVNKILSWEVLQPLSRLTYSIYLIYFPFLLIKNSSIKHATYFTDYNQVHSILGILFFVILLAVPTYLTFEAPVIALMKTTHGSDEKTTKSYMA